MQGAAPSSARGQLQARGRLITDAGPGTEEEDFFPRSQTRVVSHVPDDSVGAGRDGTLRAASGAMAVTQSHSCLPAPKPPCSYCYPLCTRTARAGLHVICRDRGDAQAKSSEVF